jgi:peptidoglycan/xylan/chitin deacetylase (PgdA/CDA1 family)
MTLLVLRYHRARAGLDGNSPEMLDAHFAHVGRTFENVLPGERLSLARPNACLAFDGAFYDFYASVFPLLRKHRLRALLAVAPATIRDQTSTAGPERLAVATSVAYSQPTADAFCTWHELEEIARSGHVAVAANGYTHRRLDSGDTDTEAEVHVPRTLLSSRLATPVESFVFPYGRFSRRALDEARSGYDFVFGEGNASNQGWRQPTLYRINADNLASPDAPFAPGRMVALRVRRFWNQLRRA